VADRDSIRSVTTTAVFRGRPTRATGAAARSALPS
jgi:hypothetical protein